MADFLLEIGTEEIPAGMIGGLVEDLARQIVEGLRASGLAADRTRPFGAPRRIGVLLEGLPKRQEDRSETVAGPSLAVARDERGGWTKAAEGFARKQGVALDQLREVEGAKGPCVGFSRHVPGRGAAEVLSEIVPRAVEGLYLPKAMRWGEGAEAFVRPVRWVAALLDDQVVPLTVKGVSSGRSSRGHRIHGARPVEIGQAGEYLDALRGAFVVADPGERVRKLEAGLEAAAADLRGRLVSDPDLVDKMAFLCEFPTVLSGRIPEEFLALPTEVLVACLREHQNFFVVRDAQGTALPHFLAVMDAPGDPKGFIRTGLENVSRSRLSDARFFYDHDKAVPLERRLEELKGIVYHPKLGTYYDKALRLEALARRIAPFFHADPDLAGRAARLCKCDLASLLVQEKEFTSLQGIAGGLYALAQGEDPALALAIQEHYGEPVPRPTSAHPYLSVAVALADKLDTLIQFFSIGLVPSGSKDPFALRRAASHVVSLLSEPGYFAGGFGGLRFSLGDVLRAEAGDQARALEDFILERARTQWEKRPIAPSLQQPTYDEINAVLSQGAADLLDMRARLEAVHVVRRKYPEDFDHLAVAFKRAKNILRGMPEEPLDPSLFLPSEEKEGAGERALYEAVEGVRQEAVDHFDCGRYAEGLQRLATVRPAVDRFFDDVLVMCDPEGKDPARTALQNNRLALLRRVVALFDRVADFSQIVPRESC